MVAPAAPAHVLGTLQVHGGTGVEVIYEVDEEGLKRLGLFGGAVILFPLVREQDVRNLQRKFLWEAWNPGYIRRH